MAQGKVALLGLTVTLKVLSWVAADGIGAVIVQRRVVPSMEIVRSYAPGFQPSAQVSDTPYENGVQPIAAEQRSSRFLSRSSDVS